MTERLSDEQVAYVEKYGAVPTRWELSATLNALAREVQERRKLDALLPQCPTCDGDGEEIIDVSDEIGMGGIAVGHYITQPCPNCDGSGVIPADRYIEACRRQRDNALDRLDRALYAITMLREAGQRVAEALRWFIVGDCAGPWIDQAVNGTSEEIARRWAAWDALPKAGEP